MSVRFWVYALADPETGAHFYVGCSQNPDSRLKHHVYESHHNSGNPHKAARIRAITARGLRPEMVLLESASSRREGWTLEALWMKECRYRGCPLVQMNQAPSPWDRRDPATLEATSFAVPA